jgi:hypothetical protein
MNGQPFTLGVTKLSVDLDNALYAQSDAGTIAFIDKKDFGGLSVTVNVPEPATLCMAVMLGLGMVAWRKNRA